MSSKIEIITNFDYSQEEKEREKKTRETTNPIKIGILKKLFF